MQKIIIKELKESIQVKRQLIEKLVPEILKVAELIIGVYQSNNKLVLFGNGGSAADAQHIACELVGRFQKERPGLPNCFIY